MVEVLMDGDLVLQDECLLRVETIPWDDLDGALRACLPVDAEPHVGVGASADDLTYPIDLAHVGMILHYKVVRLDEDILDLRYHFVIGLLVRQFAEAGDLVLVKGGRLPLDLLADYALMVEVVEPRLPVMHEIRGNHVGRDARDVCLGYFGRTTEYHLVSLLRDGSRLFEVFLYFHRLEALRPGSDPWRADEFRLRYILLD